MNRTSKPLRGIIPAPITPFDENGTVRYDLFEVQIDYLLAAGADGLMPAGTTGEGAMLSTEERRRLVEIAHARMGDRHVRCVGVLRPSTYEVLREIDEIANLAPDYVAAVTPYYTSVSQSDIAAHFTRIADHCPVPVVLYNIPQNTHNAIALESIVELIQHPNIAGVKDSSGDFGGFQRGMLADAPDDFTWIMGEDLLDAPALLMGASCIVTGLGNAWLEPYIAMRDAALRGDHGAVLAEQARINALLQIILQSGGHGLPAIKAAAALQGRSTPCTRVEGVRLSPEKQEVVRRVLESMDVLESPAMRGEAVSSRER